MTRQSKIRGQKGEEQAVRFLRSQGMEILDRNVRVGHGELDIVARDGDTLVFVEVKTAAGSDFGPPETWITPRKMRALIASAQRYLFEKGLEDWSCRFDLVAVEIGPTSTRVRHFKDAWQVDPDELYRDSD